MHTLGKVFAFLVVLAAIAASIFTAKLVQVRNSWTAKSLASKNKFNEAKPKIEALEAQIDSLKNERRCSGRCRVGPGHAGQATLARIRIDS